MKAMQVNKADQGPVLIPRVPLETRFQSSFSKLGSFLPHAATKLFIHPSLESIQVLMPPQEATDQFRTGL
jgi:hypothetical protein